MNGYGHQRPSGSNNQTSSSVGQDEVFANSSRETVVAKIEDRIMTDTSLVIKTLVGNQETGAYFCSFCPTSCQTNAALSDHIRYQHEKEIRKLSRNKLDILCFHSCPFCCARFYTKSLLPQHLIQDHCDLFSQLFKKVTEDYVRCPFCEYKVLAAFENLLAHHVDESHMVELEEYLTANHSINLKSETFLMSFCLENLPETPGLSDKFAQLTTKQKNEPKIDPKCAKRKLFTVENGKENKITKPKPCTQIDTPKQPFCWKPSVPKKPQVRFTTSTPKSHVVQRGPKCVGDFRCASCQVYFTTNPDLVLHIRQRHSALKALLNPLYGCGECHATFFKNSFVKRHRRFHHTYYEN